MRVIPVRHRLTTTGALILAATMVAAVPASPAHAVAGQPPSVIAEPATRVVPEGSSTSFTVRLSHPPTRSVYVQMSVNGTGTWAAPPMLITFGPTDWSTPKSYSIYSSPDPDGFDDIAVVTLAVPGYTPDTVTFTQLDDD